MQSTPMLQPAKSRGPTIPVPALDGRSDLLKAIRDGISLLFTAPKMIWTLKFVFVIS